VAWLAVAVSLCNQMVHGARCGEKRGWRSGGSCSAALLAAARREEAREDGFAAKRRRWAALASRGQRLVTQACRRLCGGGNRGAATGATNQNENL